MKLLADAFLKGVAVVFFVLVVFLLIIKAVEMATGGGLVSFEIMETRRLLSFIGAVVV